MAVPVCWRGCNGTLVWWPYVIQAKSWNLPISPFRSHTELLDPTKELGLLTQVLFYVTCCSFLSCDGVLRLVCFGFVAAVQARLPMDVSTSDLASNL